MVGKMELTTFAPGAVLLGAAVLLDLWWGDPQFRWHPIRLMGRTIQCIERGLRAFGWNGIAGGVALGVSTATFWTLVASFAVLAAAIVHPFLAMAVQVLIV